MGGGPKLHLDPHSWEAESKDGLRIKIKELRKSICPRAANFYSQDDLNHLETNINNNRSYL